MYYRINASKNKLVIGNVEAQADQAVYPVHRDHPNLSRKYFMKKAENPLEVITPIPKLANDSVLTDLIGGCAVGNGMQLMISDKIKSIFENQQHHGLQFFPLTLLFKDSEVDTYWLANPYGFDMHFINYRESQIQINSLGNQKIRDVIIENYSIYKEWERKISMPERICIDKVVLEADIREGIIILRSVYGGIGYYVSEIIKMELDKVGCTGIDYLAVDQA